MNKLQISWWTLLIIWTIQLVVILILVSPEHMNGIVESEYRKTETWLGKSNTQQLYAKATFQYERYFIASQFKERAYEIFLPRDVKMNNRGMERLRNAPLWDHVRNRLDSFFLLLMTILFRGRIFFSVFLLSIPYLTPVVIDGLMRREKLKLGEENASVTLYTVAKRAFMTCLFLPLFVLFWPLPISPIYLLMWTIFMGFSLWIVASHTQHRF